MGQSSPENDSIDLEAARCDEASPVDAADARDPNDGEKLSGKLGARSDLLRFLTCGSVDDGKSTLIGRLLHDSKELYDDQLRTLERDSRRVGSAGGDIDFSLLLDGLKAEREQGITIDVAYRYFSTPQRKFIIADCPGHVQYTRNMITGGSTANLAIVLIDARKGVLEQTRRHSFLVSLLDIGHIVVAINKMDLVDYSREVFETIRADYADFATRLEVRHLHFVPISALRGDNVVERSDRMSWFQGTPLLRYLETVHVASDRNLIDLRFPVQHVVRPDQRFRGYAGTLASGIIRPGTELTVLPSRQKTRVASIVTFDGELDEAFPPQAVTLTTTDEVDISRGDMLVSPRNVPRTATTLEAILVWMSEEPLETEKPYVLKACTREARAEVASIRYKFDVNTLNRRDASELELNEIGRVHIRLSQALSFDPYRRNHTTGSFIFIDAMSNGTVGAGMILDRESTSEGSLPPGADALRARGPEQRSLVTADQRVARFGHRPATIWITGLPSSGKTSIAYALEKRLFEAGCATHVIDGVDLRLSVSSGLGFAVLERSENVRRAAHVARLCNDAGLLTIVALISPYLADRAEARRIVGPERFIEVHVSAPVEVCEARDRSGLYARARSGEIPRFTGVSAPYEAPTEPDVDVPSHEIPVEEAAARIEAHLHERGLCGAPSPEPVPASRQPSSAGQARGVAGAQSVSGVWYEGEAMANSPVYIVSGLPRSGTSLMMQMLTQGGLKPLTDEIRTADEDNPRGYYEFERVKQTESDPSWIPSARGKVVKVIARLLIDLPEGGPYKVVFMRRDLDEVLRSQKKMLERRGETEQLEKDDQAMKQLYVSHLEDVEAWLRKRDDVEVVFVSYNRLLAEPGKHAARVNRFLDGALDLDAMIAAVDPGLYRNRKSTTPDPTDGGDGGDDVAESD